MTHKSIIDWEPCEKHKYFDNCPVCNEVKPLEDRVKELEEESEKLKGYLDAIDEDWTEHVSEIEGELEGEE